MTQPLSFALSEEETVAAAILHRRPRILIQSAVLFALGVCVAVLALKGAEVPDAIFIAIVFLLVFRLGTLAALPNTVREAYRSHEELRKHALVRWDATSIDIVFGKQSVATPWSALWRWKEARGLIVLYYGTEQWQVIPKPAFSDPQDLDDFRNCLARTVKEHCLTDYFFVPARFRASVATTPGNQAATACSFVLMFGFAIRWSDFVPSHGVIITAQALGAVSAGLMFLWCLGIGSFDFFHFTKQSGRRVNRAARWIFASLMAAGVYLLSVSFIGNVLPWGLTAALNQEGEMTVVTDGWDEHLSAKPICRYPTLAGMPDYAIGHKAICMGELSDLPADGEQLLLKGPRSVFGIRAVSVRKIVQPTDVRRR